MFVHIVCHKSGMFLRNAEPNALYITQIGAIPLYSAHNGIRSFVCPIRRNRVQISKLFYIVIARSPFYIFQVGGILYTKIMERTEQSPLNSIRQSNFRCHTIIKVG